METFVHVYVRRDKLGKGCVTVIMVGLVICASWSLWLHIPDSNVHGANMGSTWVLSAPDEPHVGHMMRDDPVGFDIYEY